MHLLTAAGKVFRGSLPSGIEDFLQNHSLNFTKVVHSMVFADIGIEAWLHNRSLDFLSKLIEPIMLPWYKLQDIALVRGVSGAINMFDFSQIGRVGNHQKNLLENLKANLKEFHKMFFEICKGGLGKNRKIFVSKNEKDNGHTMALSGYIMLLGSFIGLGFGAHTRNIFNRAGTLIKNFGAIISNAAMIVHPNHNQRISGAIYMSQAVLDGVQKFVNEETADIINNINMAISNTASYFYGLSSRDISDGKSFLYG